MNPDSMAVEEPLQYAALSGVNALCATYLFLPTTLSDE
jgi:hypothetical protein